MPNREILESFISILIATFNKTGFYQLNHPSYIKAIEDFRQAMEPMFNVLNPIIIGITVNSLVAKEETFSGIQHQQLARKLHLRRIKKIEITSGVTPEELSFFFSKLALPIKEIFKAGGIPNILSTASMPHLLVQKLDYSEVLTEDDSENKDIWPFLLGEAVEEEDDAKILNLSKSFGKMLCYFTVDEILEDMEIIENIRSFLRYLKNKDKEKFSKCIKEITQYIFNTTNVA